MVSVTSWFIYDVKIINRVTMALELSCRAKDVNVGSAVNMVVSTMTVWSSSVAMIVK